MDKNAYIGKYLLVGITFLDNDGQFIEKFQTYGPIVRIGPQQGIEIEKTDGSGRFNIPPGIENLQPAPRGRYRLRSTGEFLDDPDFTSTWTVRNSSLDTIQTYKARGFKIVSAN